MNKIVLINYTLNFGGAERFISGLADFLLRSGFKVSIILLDNSPVCYDVKWPIEIIQPDFRRPRNKILKIFYFIRLFFYLRSRIKVTEPDLVFNTAFPAFVLASIGKMKPVHISIRCDPENTRMIEGLNLPLTIRRLLYKRAKVIIAQTSYACRYLKTQFGHVNIITIPNFLASFEYKAFPRELIVLFVGRLIKSKGVDLLIEAFTLINNREWKLLIIGDGPERKRLEKYASEAQCNNRIEFAGVQTNINYFYQTSEIFAFPSFTEGFPNVLIEALATPLACISFNCRSGPGDIIKDGINGILVETGNLEEFTLQLKELMLNKNKRDLLKNEAIKVRSDYSLQKIGTLYKNLLFEKTG